MQSLKCPQCNLVNFATSEKCKRCGNSLLNDETINETSSSEPQQTTQINAQENQSLKLTACPDCNHLCSQMAESCPNCGRFLRQIERPMNNKISKLVFGILVISFSLVAIFFITSAKREVDVNSAISLGDAAKAGVSSKNRESAKAALNAIGEIKSVTSVGINYVQYTNAIQSAKIKFDVAMRDYEPQDAAEEKIRHDLEEALSCYIDAKDAWSEFIDEGTRTGLLQQENRIVSKLASIYGFTAYTKYGFYKDEVIDSIWRKASKTFNTVKESIK